MSAGSDDKIRRYPVLTSGLTVLLVAVLLAGVACSGSDTPTPSSYSYSTTIEPQGMLVREPGQDLRPPAEENVTIGELVRTVRHAVYWFGDTFETRPLTGCRMGASGVITLEYGSLSSSLGGRALSPLIAVYEYLPSELDPGRLSRIEAQQTNPRTVQGKRGTYALYDAALNGMPMLEVVLGDIHIGIVDVVDGDIGIMVRAADALVKVAD